MHDFSLILQAKVIKPKNGDRFVYLNDLSTYAVRMGAYAEVGG